MSREDKIKNLIESFTCDNLNRLTGSHVIGQDAITMSYQDNGNISSKSDVGETYNYGESGAGLHAVTSVDSTLSISSSQQDITYSSFNKIEDIIQGDNEMQFTYGPGNNRKITKLYNQGTLAKTKYYSINYEKEITGAGTREIHYISGKDGLFAVYIIENSVGKEYFVYKDHLGSIQCITKRGEDSKERYSFDAWGRRRNPTNWSYTNVPATYLLDRGFTGHEHLDKFGLINMNGRLYDPEIGRMLSPDNYVQMPDFTQNFNRYSYCLNNPLKFTDPDGEWVHLVIGAVIGGTINWMANGGEFTWEGLGYFGVGAAAGALGAGIGAGVGAALTGPTAASSTFVTGFIGTASATSTGFCAGFVSGASAGFTSGFILGAGNTGLQTNWNFDKMMESGWDYGWKGAVTGGVLGGISGGIDATSHQRNFWTGAKSQEIYTNGSEWISKKDYDDNIGPQLKKKYQTILDDNPNSYDRTISIDKEMNINKVNAIRTVPKISKILKINPVFNKQSVYLEFPLGTPKESILLTGWRWDSNAISFSLKNLFHFRSW